MLYNLGFLFDVYCALFLVILENVQAPVGVEPTVNVPPSSVDRVAAILQKLASTVGEFGEAMAEIGKQGAPVNVMRKTFSGISNMLNVASTMEAPSTPTASQLDDIFYGFDGSTKAANLTDGADQPCSARLRDFDRRPALLRETARPRPPTSPAP
nr:uncharacterized protein LOC109158392 [Ipomoea trifida]